MCFDKIHDLFLKFTTGDTPQQKSSVSTRGSTKRILRFVWREQALVEGVFTKYSENELFFRNCLLEKHGPVQQKAWGGLA